MTTIILVLACSGILAGAVNFFLNYVELPVAKTTAAPAMEAAAAPEPWPQIRTIGIAIAGYLTVGIAGAALVPLVNALINLGGLGADLGKNANNMTNFVLFGYGIVFGYSASRLLTGILDGILKKIAKLEQAVAKQQTTISQTTFAAPITITTADDIKQACESCFEANKDNCSGFAEAVADTFDITLTGQANDIADEIRQAGWQLLSDGAEAKEKADAGCFVVAALKGADNVPPQEHGHVAIIVSGPLAQGKYPTGYWGTLGGTGMKNTTINYAWNKDSRDKVIYASRTI